MSTAPGGIIQQDGELNQTNTCLFGLAKDMEKVREFEQVFIRLMRRYKYLEKMHEEEMMKILVYLKVYISTHFNHGSILSFLQFSKIP